MDEKPEFLRYHDDKPDQLNLVPASPVFDAVPFGPGLTHHNIPCYVCFDASAVYSSHVGVQPCWECQEHGYLLIKTKFRKHFIPDLVKAIWTSFIIMFLALWITVWL